MGRSRKHATKLSKEVSGIAVVSKSVTTNEENPVGLALEFDETKYDIWESRMEACLKVHGYDVWHFVVSGDTSSNKSRRYNTKAMNFILSALPDSMKDKVDQFSSTKRLFEEASQCLLKEACRSR